jgi:hypothetical protein
MDVFLSHVCAGMNFHVSRVDTIADTTVGGTAASEVYLLSRCESLTNTFMVITMCSTGFPPLSTSTLDTS